MTASAILPATAKMPETYTHAKWASWQWRFPYSLARLVYASAVSATGRHKACVPVVQKLVGVVAPISSGGPAMRVHIKAKHKQAEYSFKKPISRTTPVCDFLQQLCDQIAKALPIPPFNHLLFLLLSMPVIWLVCRAISSGK